MAKKGKFFVRLCYGVVGQERDTKKMTTREVIEYFLKKYNVSSPKDFFTRVFKKKSPAIDVNAPDIDDIQFKYGWDEKIKRELYSKYRAYGNFEGEFKILKETEKAYYIGVNYDLYDLEKDVYAQFWVPKSAIKSKSDKQNTNDRYNQGVKNYESLIALAKKFKVKGVRTGMRKDTIIQMCIKSGVPKSEIEKIYQKN